MTEATTTAEVDILDWNPGYGPSCNRPMFQVLPQPNDEEWIDSARWPDPFPSIDLDILDRYGDDYAYDFE